MRKARILTQMEIIRTPKGKPQSLLENLLMQRDMKHKR